MIATAIPGNGSCAYPIDCVSGQRRILSVEDVGGIELRKRFGHVEGRRDARSEQVGQVLFRGAPGLGRIHELQPGSFSLIGRFHPDRAQALCHEPGCARRGPYVGDGMDCFLHTGPRLIGVRNPPRCG